jgi:hypothetical protein
VTSPPAVAVDVVTAETARVFTSGRLSFSRHDSQQVAVHIRKTIICDFTVELYIAALLILVVKNDFMLLWLFTD